MIMKFGIKKFITLSILSLFFSLTLNAETLFFKKDGSAISTKEHASLYPIMIKNQFPTSVVFGTYADNELEAINKEIGKNLPDGNIEAFFMPTTLYQLFCLNFIGENFDMIEAATCGIIAKEVRTQKIGGRHYELPVAFAGNPEHCEQSFLDDLFLSDYFDERLSENFAFEPAGHNLNLNLAVKNLHLTINNYIVDNIKKRMVVIPRALDDFIKILNGIDFQKILKYGYLFPGDIVSLSDMAKVIDIEYHAYATGKFVLYRGTGIIEGTSDPLPDNYLISFGSTLLGGLLFDPGACAYTYMLEREKAYVLLIDKREYARGELRNMFFIPPLTSLIDLFGTGALFHSRAKVPNLLCNNRLPWMDKDLELLTPDFFKSDDFKNVMESAISHYQIATNSTVEAQGIYSRMLEYIRKNHLKFVPEKSYSREQ